MDESNDFAFHLELFFQIINVSFQVGETVLYEALNMVVSGIAVNAQYAGKRLISEYFISNDPASGMGEAVDDDFGGCKQPCIPAPVAFPTGSSACFRADSRYASINWSTVGMSRSA